MITEAIVAAVVATVLAFMLSAGESAIHRMTRVRAEELTDEGRVGGRAPSSAAGGTGPTSPSEADRQASPTRWRASSSTASRARQGSKPVLRQTAAYQCGAQTPSLSRRPGGQCSMRSM